MCFLFLVHLAVVISYFCFIFQLYLIDLIQVTNLKVTCLENLTLHGILSLSYNISVMHHLQSLWHPKIEEYVSKHFLS